MIPETRYARTADGVHIAYEVLGDGPVDLVFVMGWTSNVEAMWEEPSFARFLSRLASFARLILFDKRGVGLSDRVPETHLPSLETRMDDVRAVMDAVGSERAVVFGVSEGGPMAMLFAATYPERTKEKVRQVAEAIRGARYVEFPGDDHFFWVGDQDSLLDEIERFVAELRDQEAELERFLATVLFTDIVGSTERATELGDRRWKELLETSEVLVSQTVKDLVAGSGLAFEDRGEHELKGIPDRWRLYRVVR